MQLFESSPEEDNRCLQVRQGPPPMPHKERLPASPGRRQAVSRWGRRSLREEEDSSGNHGWGLFIYLFLYRFIFLPRVREGRRARGARWGAGWRRLARLRLCCGDCCLVLCHGLAGTSAPDVAWLRESLGLVSSRLGGLLFVFWGGEACLGLDCWVFCVCVLFFLFFKV